MKPGLFVLLAVLPGFAVARTDADSEGKVLYQHRFDDGSRILVRELKTPKPVMIGSLPNVLYRFEFYMHGVLYDCTTMPLPQKITKVEKLPEAGSDVRFLLNGDMPITVEFNRDASPKWKSRIKID